MAALPTELITDILSRLPVKSLLRFKCVCKPWNSLINSPDFIKNHLNQTLISKSDCHLLVSSVNKSLHSAELDLDTKHVSFSAHNHPLQRYDVVFLGSCNGVICLSDKSNTKVLLYNPLIKSCRMLPFNSIPKSWMDSVCFGFGYDSKNDDYKVLRMTHRYINDKENYNTAEVYSLNNNSWKCIQAFQAIPWYVFVEDCYGVLVNEALHFTGFGLISKELDLEFNFIASFDLQTEKFFLMDSPDYNENPALTLVPLLLEMGGCLCLVVNHDTSDSYDLPPNNSELISLVESFDLWVMKEYGKKESWVRMFRICPLQTLGIYEQVKPVVYSKNGKKMLLEIDHKGLGWYDLETNSVERYTAPGMPDGFLEISCFVGSLVSLEEKQHSKKKALPRKNKKKNSLDNYLSVGFKLKL